MSRQRHTNKYKQHNTKYQIKCFSSPEENLTHGIQERNGVPMNT
jgi:hypothetical protein